MRIDTQRQYRVAGRGSRHGVARRDKLEALILSRRNVGEADRLLTLFTRAEGLLRVEARGVRRIPSRRGGHLEPLTEVLAIVSGGQERMYLAAVEPIDEFLALRQDSTAVAQAQLLARVITGLFGIGEPQEQVYDALRHAFTVLPKVELPKRRLLEVAVALVVLRQAGLTPNLARCQVCDTRRATEAVILDATVGGWHCLSCHSSLAGTEVSLSPRMLSAVRWLLANPQQALRLKIQEEESRQLVMTMRAYVAAAIVEAVGQTSPVGVGVA